MSNYAMTISLDSGLQLTTYRNRKTGDTLRVHHDECGAYYGELVQANDPRQVKQRATVKQVNELLSYWNDFGGCVTGDPVIPCDCGSDQANWRGDKHGLRMYLCPDCAAHYPKLLAAENH
jgi:hypothetical protein